MDRAIDQVRGAAIAGSIRIPSSAASHFSTRRLVIRQVRGKTDAEAAEIEALGRVLELDRCCSPRIGKHSNPRCNHQRCQNAAEPGALPESDDANKRGNDHARLPNR